MIEGQLLQESHGQDEEGAPVGWAAVTGTCRAISQLLSVVLGGRKNSQESFFLWVLLCPLPNPSVPIFIHAGLTDPWRLPLAQLWNQTLIHYHFSIWFIIICHSKNNQ